MNHWTEKSIKIARGTGYLDRLHNVYPVIDGLGSVKLSTEEKKNIDALLKNGNKAALLSFLLELGRFPYDEPYVGFLRQDSDALIQNPQTVDRIWNKLLQMGTAELIEGIERPMSASRRFGQTFRNWLATKVDSCDIGEISSAQRPVSINAADSILAAYASVNLNYSRQKGLDLVILGEKISVIGEAKFISTTGGTQDKSFRESLDFVHENSSGSTRAIAVVDGVVWSPAVFKSGNSLYSREIAKLRDDYVVISSLLLPEFVKNEVG